MKILKISLAVLGLALAGSNVASAQSMSIVAGTACGGATSATFTPGGPSQTVSVCVTAPSVCGSTFKLASANAGEDGRFQITGRTRGAAFDTDGNPTYTFPISITNPANVADLGVTNAAAVNAASATKVAELVIAPQATATNNSYVISLSGDSIIATGPDCGNPGETGATASFTFNKAATPSTAVFSISPAVNVTEGGAAANATVTCTGAFASTTTPPVTVAFTTTNAAGNFTTSASPVSFSACGGQTQTITVTPRADDALVQGSQVGTIVLGAITGDTGATISTGTSTVTVADNDTPPVFAMGANAGACAEAAVPTNCTMQIVRSSGVATATTVNFTVTGTATRGTDYTLKTGGCAAGTTLAGNTISHPDANPLVIDVCPIDDLAVEGTETVILTLTAGAGYTVGAPASATQNIADDDSPQVVTVAVTGSPASEAGGVLTYTFSRTGGSAAAQAATLAVNITPPAASGRYTTTCASPITFAAATATATCTVTGVDNAVLDGNINVVVGVAAPTTPGAYTVGSPASATGVIADNEVGVSVVATTPAVTEGGLVTFTISCTGSASTSVPYTLTGLVAGDVPGGAASPIALTCGTPQTVTVQTTQNSNIGDSRSIVLTLGTPTGGGAVIAPGAGVATAAVLDDDRPVVVPTMGLLGLGLMGLMLAGIAGFQRRRLGK